MSWGWWGQGGRGEGVADHHVAVLHHELFLCAHVSLLIIPMHLQLLPAALPVLLLFKVQMP